MFSAMLAKVPFTEARLVALSIWPRTRSRTDCADAAPLRATSAMAEVARTDCYTKKNPEAESECFIFFDAHRIRYLDVTSNRIQ